LKIQTSAGEVEVVFHRVGRRGIKNPDTVCVVGGAIKGRGVAGCFHRDRFVKAQGRCVALRKALDDAKVKRDLRKEITAALAERCKLESPPRTAQELATV